MNEIEHTLYLPVWDLELTKVSEIIKNNLQAPPRCKTFHEDFEIRIEKMKASVDSFYIITKLYINSWYM